MTEERMLNDEILLGLIKANSGGGGGGTTDYDDLNNKPQIGGVTLSGNKSASDLGLATTTDLAGKQDAEDNNLTTTSKTVVGAVNELKSGLINVNTALDVPANSGKNLVDASTFDSYTSDKGITVTPNGTGGIAVSGTNSDTGATGVLLMKSGTYISLKAGVTYRFSGNWSGVTHGSLTLRMDIRPYNTLDVLASEANGGIGTFTPSEDMDVRVFVRVAGGYAIPSNVVMNPVITTLADTSYTPYIPSVESRIEAVESDTANLATSDLLYDGYPTSVDTFEQKDLVSGKNLSNYLFINVVCKHYENTRLTVIEPIHVFTTQNADSKRIVMKDADVNFTEVYYVSPTKIAVKQHVVDNGAFHTAVYGVLKKS